jgi:hypothetical protein
MPDSSGDLAGLLRRHLPRLGGRPRLGQPVSLAAYGQRLTNTDNTGDSWCAGDAAADSLQVFVDNAGLWLSCLLFEWFVCLHDRLDRVPGDVLRRQPNLLE